MRLLNTRTGEFHWVNDPSQVRYAILSHVWSLGGEQSYQDLLGIQDEVHSERTHNPLLPANEVLLRVSAKIRESCAYAFEDGFDLTWIDSCCIDKTSSAELSEAINSMYLWYSESSVCYAYLHDVDSDDDSHLPASPFRTSLWYTRGWTLQEMVAPRVVVFLSTNWNVLGTKNSLADLIEEVTGVDREVLTHSLPLSSVSVARRMFWASKRVTTRKEDEAYSLMGIFGVNMPTIYGEGHLAFVRLQEEILRQVPDQSIFVWDLKDDSSDRGSTEAERDILLASSPKAFGHSATVRSIQSDVVAMRKFPVRMPTSTYTSTAYGLRTTLPLLAVVPSISLALLACEDESHSFFALVLRQLASPSNTCVVGSPILPRFRLSVFDCFRWPPAIFGDSSQEAAQTRIVRLKQDASLLVNNISTRDVYIAHRFTVTPQTRVHAPLASKETAFLLFGPYNLLLPGRCISALKEGYTLSLSRSSVIHLSHAQASGHPTESLAAFPTYTLELRGAPASGSLAVHFGPCECTPRGLTTPARWLAARVATVATEGDGDGFASGASVVVRHDQTYSRHVDAWDHEGRNGQEHSRNFDIPGVAGRVLRLSLRCDDVGDSRHLAVFSLLVDVRDPDLLPSYSAAMASSLGQPAVNLSASGDRTGTSPAAPTRRHVT